MLFYISEQRVHVNVSNDKRIKKHLSLRHGADEDVLMLAMRKE